MSEQQLVNEYRDSELTLPTLSYISNSKLQIMLDEKRGKEAFWARYFQGKKDEPTAPMIKGRMLHEAILQPELFSKNVVDCPYENFRTKEAQKWREETEKHNQNAIILKKEEKEDVLAIVDSVRSHAKAGPIIDQALKERFGYAVHPIYGVLLSRTDIHTKEGMISDLKIMSDNSRRSFAIQKYKMKWPVQLAHYDKVDGLINNRENKGNRFYITVKDEYPFTTRVYPETPTWEMMGNVEWEIGANMIREAMLESPSGDKKVWFRDSEELVEVEPELWMVNSRPEFVAAAGVTGLVNAPIGVRNAVDY